MLLAHLAGRRDHSLLVRTRADQDGLDWWPSFGRAGTLRYGTTSEPDRRYSIISRRLVSEGEPIKRTSLSPENLGCLFRCANAAIAFTISNAHLLPSELPTEGSLLGGTC
jgi:hypothetical protein